MLKWTCTKESIPGKNSEVRFLLKSGRSKEGIFDGSAFKSKKKEHKLLEVTHFYYI